jgi:hypothetical protein
MLQNEQVEFRIADSTTHRFRDPFFELFCVVFLLEDDFLPLDLAAALPPFRPPFFAGAAFIFRATFLAAASHGVRCGPRSSLSFVFRNAPIFVLLRCAPLVSFAYLCRRSCPLLALIKTPPSARYNRALIVFVSITRGS